MCIRDRPYLVRYNIPQINEESAETCRLLWQYAQINLLDLSLIHIFHQLDWLMLTFGTAYVYEQKETGRVVSNCHKLPELSLIHI